MLDSLREQILQAIQSRLQTIHTGNGYTTDIGNAVCRSKKSIREGELPVLSIWDTEEAVDRAYGNYECTLTVAIDVAFAFDENFSVISNRYLADVAYCILNNNSELKALTNDIVYTSNTSYLVDDTYDIGGIRVEFQVNYTTVAGDPFTGA